MLPKLREQILSGWRCCICRETRRTLYHNNIRAFAFPKNKPQSVEQWKKFAKLPPEGLDYSKLIICERHFKDEDIKHQGLKTILKYCAIPCLLPPETSLTFPNIIWNPNEEPGSENGEAGLPSAMLSEEGSFYSPEHSTADDYDESDPLNDTHNIPLNYENVKRTQLLENLKSELCRICGKKEGELSPIHSEHESAVEDELSLLKKLEMYLPLEINPRENLPMGICEKCRQLVLSWHELYVASLAADGVLRVIFGVGVKKSDLQENHSEEEEETDKMSWEGEGEEEEETEVQKETYEMSWEGEGEEEETEIKKETEKVSCLGKEEEKTITAPVTTTIIKEFGKRSVEETNFEAGDTTLFKDLETVCEEVETTYYEETKCEEGEMRSEKENYSGQDNIYKVEGLYDDTASLDFKKQPVIKCYSTKRGVAELREMRMSPDKEFETDRGKCGHSQHVRGLRRTLKFRAKSKECPEEEEIFSSQTDANLKIRKPPSGTIGEEKSIFYWKTNIKENFERCTTVLFKPLTCSHCNEIFTEWEEYKRHKRKCRLEPTVCEECGAKISQRVYLKKHLKTHLLIPKVRQKMPRPAITCEWCNKIFKTKFALRCHLDAFHNGENGEKEPTNYCEPCCKVFVSNISYKMHLKQHEDGSVKNCINLELIAADGDNSELSYNCPVCELSFSDKMKVVAHMNTLNVKKCPTCRIRMSNERFTFIHKCKYWYCRFCNKQFYNKNRYEIHERVHTRERPYMCHICGKKFVSSESLFTHKKGHGKPAFKCEECGKLFKKKVLYNMHLDSHAGKHYTCKYCNKNFTYQNNLSKHCKRAHRDILSAT